MKNLIEIQTASATQTSNDDGRSKWIVNNEEGKKLYELPEHWNEKDAMDAIHFTREFELLAFNKGIQQGKKIQNNINNSKIATLEHIKNELMGRNEMLGNELEKLMEE